MAVVRRSVVAVILIVLLLASSAQARTVYRCVRRGTISLATAPEPGSRCVAKEIDDNAARLPNLWGTMGAHSGTLYERVQDGVTVYSTRNLPGSVKLLAFTVPAPPGSPAHAGLGALGPPRLDVYRVEFRAAARATGVDEAWLRAIAHAESGFDSRAISPKGAQGVMQLMPEAAKEYGVTDPFSSRESIRAGALRLKALSRRYRGDLMLVAAAYNAGTGAVQRYGGVPPYAETEDYVAKVMALHARYRTALAAAAKPGKRRR